MMPTTFTAPYDRTVSAVSVVFGVIMFGLPIVSLGVGIFLASRGVEGAAVPIVIGAGLLVVAIIGYLLAPSGYEVRDDAFAIQRHGISPILIPLATVGSVEQASRDQVFRGAVRWAASGGLFGYYGAFQSPGLGYFKAYATDADRLVILRLKSGSPVVVSPDDVEGFVATVGERITVTS